jgi:uncharacterized protein YggT (Ycf19 family)
MGDHGSILEIIINNLSQPFIFVNSILPHEIKDFGLAIRNFIFFNLYSTKAIIIESIQNLDKTSPDLVEALRFLKLALTTYINTLYIFYLFRLVIYWFPNYNPYLPPLYIVMVMTQPLLTFLDKALPNLFGMNFSFLIITIVLTLFTRGLDNLNF